MSAVGSVIFNLIELINVLVIVWCLLSWFPNIKWYEQPWKTLDMIVRPILEPFRRIIPPIGNIDISPMIALLALQALGTVVQNMLARYY